MAGKMKMRHGADVAPAKSRAEQQLAHRSEVDSP